LPVLHVLTLPHIYVAALLEATVTVWFDAADFGALSALVGRERVVTANSYLQSAATVRYQFKRVLAVTHISNASLPHFNGRVRADFLMSDVSELVWFYSVSCQKPM
jgi:hypothetical protein